MDYGFCESDHSISNYIGVWDNFFYTICNQNKIQKHTGRDQWELQFPKHNPR